VEVSPDLRDNKIGVGNIKLSGSEIPDHKFVYKDQEIQTGPKKGEIRKTVTLIIPPYLFCRKTDARSVGSAAYFVCTTCGQLDVQNTARATKYEDENGAAYYELTKWPIEHACAPGGAYHLVKDFRDKCYDAVAQDPTKSISQLYKDIREEMCSSLTDDEKKSFLDEIPELNSIKPQLYNHRRKFIPKTDHPCDLCGQTFISVNAVKIHEAAKHNMRAPKKTPMCDICGKIFKRSDHLNRHIATIHTKSELK
jgi:hypothetical protein